MQEIKLNATKREIIGRKVKEVRALGLIPANVYGKKIKSQTLALKKDDFDKAFSRAGATSVVKLNIKGEKEERPILIQNIQRHPVSDEVLHVDLRQIILTEKVSARVPVEFSGESPAVVQKLGILIQPISEIEVEALPMDLPERFIVDVSKLVNVGDEIKVFDLSADKKVELKVEANLVVAKIDPLAAEEVTFVPVEAPIERETPAEGETPVESGAQAETPKEEEKKE